MASKGWVRTALLVFLSICCLIVVLTAFVLTTSSGPRIAISLVNALVPSLHVQAKTDGTLSNLRLQNLIVESDGKPLMSVDQAEWQIDLLPLLKSNLRIRQLTVQELHIAEGESNDQAHIESPSPISLPINLTLEHAEIQQITFGDSSNTQELARDVVLRADMRQSKLALHELALKHKDMEATTSGNLDLSFRPARRVQLNAKLLLNPYQQISDIELSGTWRALKLKVESSGSVPISLVADIEEMLDLKPSWNAQLRLSESYAIDEQNRISEAEFSSKGRINLNQGLSSFAARFNASAKGQNALGNWNARLSSDIDENEIAVQELVAEMRFSDQQTLVPGESPELVASGSIGAWQDALNTNSFAPLSVNLDGQWRRLCLDPQTDHCAVSTDGQFQAKDTQSSGGKQIELELNGKLVRDNQASQFGEYQAIALLSDTRYELPNFFVKASGLDITGSALITDTSEIDLAISSQDLSELDQRLAGVLDLQVEASASGLGQQAAISSIKLTGDARELLLDTAQLGSANIALSSDINKETGLALDEWQTMPVLGAIRVTDLGVDNQSIVEQAEVQLEGRVNNHSLSVDIATATEPPLAANSVIRAGLIADENEQLQWRGSLNALQMEVAEEQWQLQDHAPFEITGTSFDLKESCLRSAAGQLCLAGQQVDQNLRFQANAEQLSLALVNPLLASRLLALDGAASFALELSLPNQGPIDLKAEFEAQSMAVTSLARSRDARLDIERVYLSINEVEQDRIQGEGSIVLDTQNVAKLSFAIDNELFTTDLNELDIEAALGINFNELSNLPGFATANYPIKGRLTGDLELGGTVAKPNIGGTLSLSDSELDLPELGLRVRDVQLAFKPDARLSDDAAWSLIGSAQTSEGVVAVEGKLNREFLTRPELNLSLSSDRLLLVNTPDAYAIAALDLSSELSQQLVSVSGDIELEQARLNFQLSESVIRESADVVIVSDDVDQQTKRVQELDIRLNLGQQTRFQARGLQTDLVGELRVFQKPGGLIRAQGQINMRNAVYKEFGQTLNITKGEFVFTGGSIDNPGIRLLVERSVDDIEASLSIDGTVSQPRLSLQSNSGLSDRNILAYLVFGRSADNLGVRDLLTLAQIANAARGGGGGNGVSNLIADIQNTLGLSELDVTTGDDASLVAGKRLSDKFYVGYGYGLLSATHRLILNYSLNQHWSLKAGIGAEKGIDLRYQVER